VKIERGGPFQRCKGRWCLGLALWVAMALPNAAPVGAAGSSLETEVGRNETRVYAAPYFPVIGRTIAELAIPERLERLDYVRVRGRRPDGPGEYFWGHEVFWIYRREHRVGRKRQRAQLLGLRIERGTGKVLGFQAVDDGVVVESPSFWLEPELVAESFDPRRAKTSRVSLDDLPDHVWQAILALEDHRFFDHSGVDPRSVARAALRNAKRGGVVQGGSTITQQLIKIRDLTPKRKFRRKASEAIRALALEQRYAKREILQAYLNAVYYGHVDGISIYGLGTAARAYYGKSAKDLSLGEAAVLAAMLQAPNRLNPQRPSDELRERTQHALDRLAELKWVDSGVVERARRAGLPRLRVHSPARPEAAHFRTWVRDRVEEAAPKRSEEGKGFVAWTTLDPFLQAHAESVVEDGLADLRRRYSRLGSTLSAALVSIDTRNGAVIAYVGGDPAARSDGFDRARSAKRQPGSTVKPIALLELFERCGSREALYPARRVADRPLELKISGSKSWAPENSNGEFRGTVTIEEATVDSLNVPFVRLAGWCGFDAVADRYRRAGLPLGADPPPSFVLGAVEASPLEIATGFSAVAAGGHRSEVRPLTLLSRPSGWRLHAWRPSDRRVVGPETAYLVRDLMRKTVASGTATPAQLDEPGTYGKTGTSSDRRDAWFVGGHGDLLTVVWVGLDDGKRLGLSGASGAAPLWRNFMERAVATRPAPRDVVPENIVKRWVEPSTGLLTSSGRRGSNPYLFKRGVEPPRRRIWRTDAAVPVVE